MADYILVENGTPNRAVILKEINGHGRFDGLTNEEIFYTALEPQQRWSDEEVQKDFPGAHFLMTGLRGRYVFPFSKVANG